MILDLIKIGGTILDKIIPDPVERDKAKLELLKMEEKGEFSRLKMQMETITAEAKGESWIQRNWRPLTMLTFVILVVAKWLGLTAPDITAELEMKILEIIQIGLGGYIVSRGVEKSIKEWKNK